MKLVKLLANCPLARSAARAAATADELARFLATRLAKYKILKEFISVDNLPRTPYGKVIKASLRNLSFRSRSRGRGIP